MMTAWWRHMSIKVNYLNCLAIIYYCTKFSSNPSNRTKVIKVWWIPSPRDQPAQKIPCKIGLSQGLPYKYCKLKAWYVWLWYNPLILVIINSWLVRYKNDIVTHHPKVFCIILQLGSVMSAVMTRSLKKLSLLNPEYLIHHRQPSV